MSNLPHELLDHIVDLLHDNQTPLRNCCLVSKSWVARTRRHLFAEVVFQTMMSLESWKKTFPDPSTSPARYVKALSIGYPQVVTAPDAEAGRWMAAFSRVECLELGGQNLHARGWEVAFVLFHGFSPVVKSIRMKWSSLPFLRFLYLILTFPLLEDLAMINCHNEPPIDGDYSDWSSTVVQSPSSPTFTGSLELLLRGGMGLIADRLLSLPNGICFRKLTLSWFREEDVSLTVALVERCSRTLESLDISCNSCGTSTGHLCLYTDNLLLFLGQSRSSFNLSKATKLSDAVFRLGSLNVEWVILALQTAGDEHQDLRRISIDVPSYLTRIHPDIRAAIGEGTFGQWLDLDSLLVHLWESRSIRPSVIRTWTGGNQAVGDCIGSLLPEMMKRGMIDLVE